MLHRCDFSGDVLVHGHDPDVRIVSKAVFIPQKITGPDSDPDWGVYGPDLHIIEEAALKRGPGRNLIGQSNVLRNCPCLGTTHDTFIYGGSFHHHYGHFILSVLPRFWDKWRRFFPGIRILLHSHATVADWFSIPFVRTIFDTLGLHETDFAVLHHPSVIDTLIVPGPSFIETSTVYAAFDRLGNEVGARLLPNDRPVLRRSEPLYLSKEKISRGIWGFENESEFVSVLHDAGVRIEHPETMSLRDQIRMFAEHDVISGLVGSALHTTAIFPGRKKIVALAGDRHVLTNFSLVDTVKGNEASYVYSSDVDHRGRTERFGSEFHFKEPAETAKQFLQILSSK